MILIFTIIFIGINALNAQTIKVAILDFENTSGIAKYNGLGKAMSSMLITDIEANVSPKRLQLVERSQIQKILKEQNFQASSAIDKTSSVKAGKLLGVKYLLVGDIYILNDVLVINARLTDIETGEIKFSKKQEGKLVGWLGLKTNIAKELAKDIAMPFTEPNIPDKEINMATITSFGNAITAKDDGKIDKAEELVNTIQEFSPDFKYLDDLKGEIEKLKNRVSEIENITNIITNNFELGYKAEIKGDFKNTIKYFESFVKNPETEGYVNNKILYAFSKISSSFLKNGQYSKALVNSEKAIKIYKYFPEANEVKLMALIKLNQYDEAIKQYDFIIDSLTFENELAYRSLDNLNTLNWDAIDWPNFGLKLNNQSEELFYLGIKNAGYGSNAINEVQLKKVLSENKIESPINKSSKNRLNQYDKLELKLIELKDSEVFSSRNILNFYNVSLTYADELYIHKDFKKYEDHLIKEIRRMEGFGIPCIKGCSDGERISSEKYRSFLFDNGLSNSGQDFTDNYHLIYGKFKLKYLNYLIEKDDVIAASKLYHSLTTEYVKDRKSFFYESYWDMILGIRKITSDFNSTLPIDKLVFQKKINKLILENPNITKEKLQSVIDYKLF
jgi:TolB-like protein/tetratricopeptide (TPR) repeat protein